VTLSKLPVNLRRLAEASLVVCLENKKTWLDSALRWQEH